MSFFYDLNKKLDSIRATPEVTHKQLNERDMSRAAKGYEKYGKQGMEALAKAGREGKALDPVRKKYDKYDNEKVSEESGEWSKIPVGVIDGPGGYDGAQQRIKDYESGNINRDGKKLPPVVDKSRPADKQLPPVVDKSRPAKSIDEGPLGFGKKMYDLGKRAASGINKMIGHGSDEEMLGTLKKDVGVIHPTGGKRPTPPGMQSTGDTPRDIFLKGETSSERAARLGDPRVKNANDEGVKEAGAPMTAKQKSFAKLAPPAGKITFADKIAGAKKEVDEMLGDVAAEAMRNALSPKQKKIDMNKNGKLDANDFAMLRKGAKPEMDEERSKGTAFDPDTPRASTPKVGSIERGAKHDIKHTATGRVVTRRTDDQGNSVGADDDTDADAAPRGRGRPKGTKNVSSRAKVFQRKSKLMTKEGEDDPAEKGEYDREGDMALDDIDTIESAANELQSIINADDNLPEWVQSKINKAMDYLDTARDYMAAQGNDQEPIAEKAVSKQQQKFMGMAHAMQKGEKIKGASKELKTVAQTMKPKDTKDFAKTKHKGLPDKVKKKEVDENSEEGRLVTKRTGPGQSLTTSTTGRISATVDKGKVTVKPAKSGGISYGQGIYDSMNRELEQMIAESMSVNMSDSTEGNRSLTVTATDEDAMKLAMILKSAGLGGHGDDMHSHGEQPCDTCGMQECGCGDVQEAVDENAPDWPTNTEQADNNFGYAGGLNKPKTDVAGDGQTTIPNTAVHTQDEDALRRMMEMAGVKQAELEPWKETMKEEEEEEVEEDFLESIQRMREIAGIKEAKKPDFLDMDKDGDKEEPMSKAVKDKEEKKVDESIFALTNQWKAYKG